MKAKFRNTLGAMLIAALVLIMVLLLVPGFATFVGQMIANLWVAVMAAVAGLLGGMLAR